MQFNIKPYHLVNYFNVFFSYLESETMKHSIFNYTICFADISKDGVGFWLGAKRARGSHSGTCMYDQWKWVDSYNREMGTISGFAAFIPNKPDK